MVKGFHDCMCFYYISSAFVGVSTFFFIIFWFLYRACITCTIMHLLIFKSVDLTHSIVTISALFFLFLPKRIYSDLYIRKKNHNLYTRRIISRHLPGILYMNLLFRAFIFLHIAYNHTFFIVMFCLFFNGRAILSIF